MWIHFEELIIICMPTYINTTDKIGWSGLQRGNYVEVKKVVWLKPELLTSPLRYIKVMECVQVITVRAYYVIMYMQRLTLLSMGL